MAIFNSFLLYKQYDVMDCGPTCLQMIAKHYGKYYPLNELRQKSYITKEGVSLLGISEAAESIGFRTLGVQMPFDKLIKESPFPFIAHWNQNHFVVVYAVKKNKVFVADPIGQKAVLTKEEFLKSWLSHNSNGNEQGVALILEPSPSFFEEEPQHVAQKRKSLLYLFNYFKQYKKFILQLFIGLLLGSLIQLFFPFLTQSIVDVGINTRNLNFIYLILTAQVMLFFSRTFVDFIRRWILLHLSTRINISIISDFLIKLMQLPLSFFDTKMTGDLLQRISDHQRIQSFLSSSSLSILFSFMNLFIFGIVLALYHIPIFFVFFAGSVIYAFYVILFLRKRKELDYRRFNQMSANQSSLIQLITGMQEIKLNGSEKLIRWKWERIQAKLFKVDIASTRLQQYQEAGSLFINELKNILITFMAANAVIDGNMTLGMMLAVQYIIGQLNAPINESINFMRQWQDAKIALERIGEIHGLENEEKTNNWETINILSEKPTLSLRNLCFKYEGPHSAKALDGISMDIPEGKVTAIVGTSGSGKTTLMKLLLKFYAPSEGTITLGGIDLSHISSKEWRKLCGAVMQDGTIFSDSIANNIGISDENVDKTKLLHSVSVANIKEHIESLPLGYNTKVGQDGSGLSQGQKQRLLIARAVYKNPEFIFFDEATSALDANNEKVIMNNLNEFFHGRTVLVIAHRLSTVKNADQIIVLDKGKIKETGTHHELVQLKGSYYELVKNQLELGV